MTSPDFPDVFSLKGETALITGGGTGLGFGMARCMAAAGAKVVLVGRREAELQNACSAISGNAFAVAADITKLSEAENIVQQAGEAAGSAVSILINNAGIHLKKPAVETGSEEFQAVLSTHVCAAQALTRAALPGMLERGHGSILFTASMASLLGIPLVIAYSAAKSACVGMVRTLSAEVSPQGVRVNAIAPGWIESPMLRKALDNDPKRSEKILSRTPMNRFGTDDEIGWTAVFLCSKASGFITGAVLPVDGGASIGF